MTDVMTKDYFVPPPPGHVCAHVKQTTDLFQADDGAVTIASTTLQLSRLNDSQLSFSQSGNDLLVNVLG